MPNKHKHRHTPGPWTVGELRPRSESRPPFLPILSTVDGITYHAAQVGTFDVPSDEQVANAYLIAEAPEMLAAIKTALHSIEQARRTVDGSQPADLPGCVAALDWIADDLKHAIRIL